MTRETVEQHVLKTYGIQTNQIYQDTNKRNGFRKLIVLSVASKPGKAACATCDENGYNRGRTLWIQFTRLSDKSLYKPAGTYGHKASVA